LEAEDGIWDWSVTGVQMCALPILAPGAITPLSPTPLFPSTVNELGIKGVGESGVIAPGAMIAGAVEDALADRGVTINSLPVTPARVFEALRDARRNPHAP